MKIILILSVLMFTSFSFAGDAYLSCFDSEQELVDSKYVDLYSDQSVQIEFSDMSTDKYFFEVSFKPQSYELTYKVFDINSMILIQETTLIVSFYDEVNLISGHMCSLVD
jgi:hypothetical protein